MDVLLQMSSAMSSHRFIWRRPIASPENFGALISVLKSLGAVVVFKVGSQTSDACAEATMRAINRLLLVGLPLPISQ